MGGLLPPTTRTSYPHQSQLASVRVYAAFFMPRVLGAARKMRSGWSYFPCGPCGPGAFIFHRKPGSEANWLNLGGRPAAKRKRELKGNLVNAFPHDGLQNKRGRDSMATFLTATAVSSR